MATLEAPHEDEKDEKVAKAVRAALERVKHEHDQRVRKLNKELEDQKKLVSGQKRDIHELQCAALH